MSPACVVLIGDARQGFLRLCCQASSWLAGPFAQAALFNRRQQRKRRHETLFPLLPPVQNKFLCRSSNKMCLQWSNVQHLPMTMLLEMRGPWTMLDKTRSFSS